MKRLLVLLVVAAAVVLLAVRGPALLLGPGWTYTAELPDAAGIRAGDEVRVAGIAVGEVVDVAAHEDRVHVELRLDRDVPLTEDTRSEVKLATLLGTRYLALTPGTGVPLDGGDRLALEHAYGSYTLERFWLDNARVVGELDLPAISRAIDVLATDLNGRPASNRAAIDGLAELASIVTERDGQISRLLEVTRSVTDDVVAQRRQLLQLVTRGDRVLQMVEQRKEAIDALLRDSRAVVDRLATMARRNRAPMRQSLRDLRRVLGVLAEHRDDLARTLELADPALRLYVNSAGDGPWLGVNSPYFIFPDSWVCRMTEDIGC